MWLFIALKSTKLRTGNATKGSAESMSGERTVRMDPWRQHPVKFRRVLVNTGTPLPMTTTHYS